MDQDTIERHRALSREVLRTMPPFPDGRFAGRGVVICGGGSRYFTCAWVCINMLRHNGCELPVELWHLGPLEVNDEMRALVAPLGVTCIDGYEVRKEHPVRTLNGWELKPYAILHSRFEEVLFLDADNVPLVNPEIFFESREYRTTGAVFWPDFWPLAKQNAIWEMAEVEYHYEPSFESGQIVVDKRRCWDALQLTMHYNEHSNVYYQLIGGDKDTFHVAWRRLSRPYAMIPHHPHALADCVINQHDFAGNVVFHHRNNAKWKRNVDANPRIGGFREEERCLGYLRELEASWNGEPARLAPDSPRAGRLHDEVVATERYVYERVGFERRIVRLRADQGIDGAGGLESSWFVRTAGDGEPELCIAGLSTLTLTARPLGHGVLGGAWLIHERMPINLTPLALLPVQEQLELAGLALQTRLRETIALLVNVRRDRRLVRLERDGRLSPVGNGRGNAGSWSVRTGEGEILLTVSAGGGEPRDLVEEADGVFRTRRSEPARTELIPLEGVEPA
jgi:hypothetical protein